MNSDYILKGRGQLAIHQPDWARFTPASEMVRLSESDDASTPLPTAKPAKAAKASHTKAASTSPERLRDSAERMAQTDESAVAQQAQKTRFNEFTHGGGKKSVGPETDTVDFTFEDFLDTINPLQQIPVVNMIYREITGDRIKGASQVMGSALYWGPLGVVTGAIDAIFEQEKGGDLGETVMASLMGTETPGAKKLPSNNPITNAPDTMLAQNEQAEDSDEETLVADAEPLPAPLPTPTHDAKKLAAKQPFGGIMDSQTPNAAQAPSNAAPAPDAAPAGDNLADAAPAAAKPIAVPQHAPTEVQGRKMYSLAGITRHPSVATHMPQAAIPDPRLKSYGKQMAPITSPIASTAGKPDAAAMLGLSNPAAALAASPTLNSRLDDSVYDELPATHLPDPGFAAPTQAGSLPMEGASAGNPLPPQLIQDMMLLNMQKYQNGVQNGTLRGHSVDVNG